MGPAGQAGEKHPRPQREKLPQRQKICPAGIDIAMVNKLYDLASMQGEVPATVRAHYQALSATAADCIACGGCETRCPFGVPVVERMEKAKKLFG